MPDDNDDLLEAAGINTAEKIRDIATGAGKMVGKSAAELLGLPDAMRALRGQMTPDEAKHFALTAAMGLVPGGKMENMLAKGATKMAGASIKPGNLIAHMALKGDVPTPNDFGQLEAGMGQIYPTVKKYAASNNPLTKAWEGNTGGNISSVDMALMQVQHDLGIGGMAGFPHATPASKAPLGPEGYKLVPAAGDYGDYFVHGPNGKIGGLTKDDKWYHLEMENGASKSVNSLAEGLDQAAAFHQKSSLSDKAIKNALQENPGASIFDVAGVDKPKAKNPHLNDMDAISAEYNAWAKKEGLPALSMDEQDWQLLTGAQQDKLMDFQHKWGKAESAFTDESNYEDTSVRSRSDVAKHLQPLDWQEWRGKEGGNPAEFEDVMARERARSLGFNVNQTLFKGGRHSEYPDVTPSGWMKKSIEPGMFLGDTRHVAGQYGNATLPYVARSQNPLTVDWQEATGYRGYDSRHMDTLVKAARDKGSDLLVVKNIDDLGGHQNQYVVLDPKILRAPEAQFDPNRVHEAAPLAGIAGVAGAGAAAATGLNFDEDGNPWVQQR